MRTEFILFHRHAGTRGYDEFPIQFPTVLEARNAAGYPEAEEWNTLPDERGWGRGIYPSECFAIRPVQVPETDFERIELAIEMLMANGSYDGGHHKMWAIDQAVRILSGDRYGQLVTNYCAGEDGPETYEWDEGVAP